MQAQELITKHQDEFERYYELYMAYNSHTNISAIRDREGVYAKHFVDSLAALPFINGLLRHCVPRNDEQGHCEPVGRSNLLQVLDIGTGGGFPAVPLAIVLRGQPIKITALDSVGKKTKFVEEVKRELGLDNLEVIKARAEEIKGRYDIITSRALAMLSEPLPYVSRLLTLGGIYIAYKKLGIDEEIKAANPIAYKYKLELVEAYNYDSKQLLIYKKH